MNNGVIIIGITVLIIAILIYILKNSKTILKFYEEKKDRKILKIIRSIVIYSIIFILVLININFVLDIKENIEGYKFSIKNDKEFEKFDNLLIKENEFYKTAMAAEYDKQNYSQPYIPAGFSYVEGEWNSGYVIQDENGNQYVWIPCTNKDIEGIPVLSKSNFTQEPYISKDMCINENYEKFILSSLENGGFYVSRYEIGKENEKPVSKSGVEVWNNVSKNDAQNIIKNINLNMNCELMNGYAYDTILSWILQRNDVELTRHNINDKIMSGTKAYNNIYDFCDNTMEITTESNYGTVIIRGFHLIDENIDEYNIKVSNLDRFSIREEDKSFSAGTTIGFRTIIYK